MTEKATEKPALREVKRVDVKLLVSGHQHRGFEIAKGDKINVTEPQAERLVKKGSAVRA